MESSPANLRHPILLGLGLILAPALMLAADASAAVAGEDLFWLPNVGLWLSFYAYVAAIVAMARLAGGTGIAVAGAVLAMFGSLIGVTIMGLERMAWSARLHGVDPEVVQRAISEPVVFFTSRSPGLAFPIGLLLLAWALARAGVLSRPAALVLAAGIVLFPVGRIAAGPWANAAGDTLMLAALAPLGVGLLRRRSG